MGDARSRPYHVCIIINYKDKENTIGFYNFHNRIVITRVTCMVWCRLLAWCDPLYLAWLPSVIPHWSAPDTRQWQRKGVGVTCQDCQSQHYLHLNNNCHILSIFELYWPNTVVILCYTLITFMFMWPVQ